MSTLAKLLIVVSVLAFPFSAFAAIAFDAGSSGSSSSGATTLSVSQTVTGSNPYLVVTMDNFGDFGGADGACTYNGVSMTLIGHILYATAGGRSSELTFGLTNPATGTHNIVCTRSSTTSNYVVLGASYTGVGGVDASTTARANSSSLTSALSSTKVNDWFIFAVGAGNTLTASTNVHQRENTAQTILGDSNAAEPIGSFSQTVTLTSTIVGGEQVALYPYVAPVSAVIFPKIFSWW